MLNRYPLWKYLLVLFVIVIGFLYAAPNLYGEDPALQVSNSHGDALQVQSLDQIKDVLEKDKIPFKSVSFDDSQILVRFHDTDDQLKAQGVVAKALGSNYVVALNLAPATPAWLKAIGGSPMKLGLDLRGGIHFQMQVDMNEAINKTLAQTVQDFRTDLRTERIRYSGIRQQKDQIYLQFRNEESRTKAMSYLREHYRDFLFTEANQGGRFAMTAAMTQKKLQETQEYALQQNITIIRNRVNELGVSEPLVQRQGADRIIVELPGVQDATRAKEILGATATLEFRMVDENADPAAAAAGQVPPGDQLLYNKNDQPVVLKKQVILTGNHITDAQSAFDEYSRPQVSIKLDGSGGNRMSEFTKDNVGKAMATVFIQYKPVGKPKAGEKPKFKKVEEVINVATIQSRLGRNFRITGLENINEAHNLALLLRAGALIAPIQIIGESTIGPSLGQQNIKHGFQAMVYGTLILLVFMMIYYRKFGLIANLAVLCNLVLIVGAMSLIPGATMTLPGIAGMVLTMGMAVDANVLIFERIREELNAGRGIQQAISLGYERAFSTIADANVTTLISAVILFAIGTGSVKGFAVTLMIGIAASMFTAITGTRAIVNLIWGGKRVKSLSI
ncbi:protein translocase subunit SecD [Dongshaea marina]|uniref:protein translocase subunit SecD n=1 Tax=Dongshaea marina TaxID=2047966 RepID=UPI000D3E170D|nr:protein translocase subunit SecD [Dongshaea marina]